MSSESNTTSTPFFVLKSGNQAIHPTIEFADQDTNCVCVYGFSAKPVYDKFIKNTEQHLTPYPLVKGYLANQVAESTSSGNERNDLRLVILDATDFEQPVLSAAKMGTVLLAHQEKAKQVPIEYELIFDPKTTCYSFKGVSGKMRPVTTVSIAKIK